MNNSSSATLGAEPLTPTDDFDSNVDEVFDESLSLKITRFLRLCWLRRKLFIPIVAAGILLTLLSAFLQPSRYTSITTLMPPNNTSSYSSLMTMLTSSSAAASLGSEALGLATPGELFVAILQSRNVEDRLISRFDLSRYYNMKLLVDTRKNLEGDTKVLQDRKSGIITISVTVLDPVLASKLAQGYVEELNRVLTEDSTSSARRERIFLEGRVSDVKQQLDDTAKALSQFSTKNGTIDMSSQARSMMDAGLKLQAELIDGRSQLAALRQTYSEDNSRVRAVEARNAELQRQIDAMGGLHQDSASNGNENQSGLPAANQLPALGLTYYDLERKLRVQEALWETLTKQYEAAKVEEVEQIPTPRVLDAAAVPERKSGPSRRLIVLIGTILSLLAACLSVITVTVWEGMDSQNEPKKLLSDIAGAVTEFRSRPRMGGN